MISQLIKYIRDHAISWPVKLNVDGQITPLFRFNKEANGIVESEQIGVIIFWFSEGKRNPCLVTKVADNSLSVEYIKACAKRQQEINKKVGVPIFQTIYDVAEVCDHSVIFQEAINIPTYEMELKRAICGPSGNLSTLRWVIKRHFKEISFLFNHLKKFDVSKKFLQWGNWAYQLGKDFRNNYDLKLDFVTDDGLDRMRKEINSMALQKNYVLTDHYCANYFAGPRVVDQIDKTLPKRMSNEPGIIDVFRFIIAYFRTSPLNAVYKDWLDAIAFSIIDKDRLIMTGLPLRDLLRDIGLNLNEPRKIWALVMVSFFLRVMDELTFHKQNIFIISRLKNEFEQSTKRLVEIQDLIENSKDFDFSSILQAEEAFIPPSKLISTYNLEQPPHLIEEGCKGFNIVLYRNKYYAISQDIGTVDLTKLKASELKEYQISGKCFVEDSLKQLRSVVNYNLPELVDEGYRGFNIVGYKDKFYAVSQLLGPVDFTVDSVNRKNKDSEWFVGDSYNQVKNLVNQVQDNLVKEKLDEAESMTAFLKKESAARTEELAGLRSELERERKESETRAGEIDALKIELEKTQREFALRTKELAGLRSELEKTRKESDTRAGEIDALKIELEKTQREFALRTEELAGLRSELEKTISESETRAGEISVQKIELKKTRQEILSLTRELTGLRSELEKTREESDARDREIDALKIEMGKTIAEKESIIEILDREYRNYQLKYKSLAEDFKIQSDYLGDVRNRLSNIQSSGVLRLVFCGLKNKLGDRNEISYPGKNRIAE